MQEQGGDHTGGIALGESNRYFNMAAPGGREQRVGGEALKGPWVPCWVRDLVLRTEEPRSAGRISSAVPALQAPLDHTWLPRLTTSYKGLKRVPT